MKYWTDLRSGTCVCKMAWDFDTPREGKSQKSNLDHALDYICGKMERAVTASCDLDDWMTQNDMRELLTPFVAPYIKDVYCGKAHCSPQDIFNEEKGIEIARARCLTAFYSDVIKAAARVDELLQQLTNLNRISISSAARSEMYWEKILHVEEKN